MVILQMKAPDLCLKAVNPLRPSFNLARTNLSRCPALELARASGSKWCVKIDSVFHVLLWVRDRPGFDPTLSGSTGQDGHVELFCFSDWHGSFPLSSNEDFQIASGLALIGQFWLVIAFNSRLRLDILNHRTIWFLLHISPHWWTHSLLQNLGTSRMEVITC